MSDICEVTQKLRDEYRQIWGRMPYCGSMQLNFDICLPSINLNLRKLQKRLEELAEENKAKDEELDKLRRLVRAVGEFNRLANEAAAPDKTQTGQR